MIVGYVPKSDTPLEIPWSLYSPGRKTGQDKGLNDLNALTRTSKQVYAELSNIFWAINEFAFSAHMMHKCSLNLNSPRPESPALIEKAIQIFVRNTHPKNIKLISLVHLDLSSYYGLLTGGLIESIPSLVQNIPNARWTVRSHYWTISDSAKRIHPSEIGYFTRIGHALAHKITKEDIERKWRLYPRIVNPSIRQTKQKLIAAGVEEAEKWIEKVL